MPLKTIKRVSLLCCLAALSACAHLPLRGGRANERTALWDRAHAAFYADSFATAYTTFRQLAAGYPSTYEGREARFYVGALLLEPRNPGFDAPVAEQQLRAYIAQDTVARQRPLWHRIEATALANLAAQFQRACETRISALRCETRVVERRSGAPAAPAGNNGASSADVERLQAAVADRDEQIQKLREELNRIRNTLVPRRP